MPMCVEDGLTRRIPLDHKFHLRLIRFQVEDARRLPDQFLSRVTYALASLPVHINNGPFIEIVDKEGVACVVHKRAEARLALAQRFHGTLACGPGTQGDDAERQVASQFLKKPNLFRCRSVGLRGINGEAAKRLVVFVLERQGDAGTITVLQSALPPGHNSRIRCEILSAASFPAPDGRSGGAASKLRVGPSEADG